MTRVAVAFLAVRLLASAGQVTTPVPAPASGPVKESPSLLEGSPAGWISVQPGPDLAGWTRLPWTGGAPLGPQQWSVDPGTGHLICDGKAGHDWLRYDKELGDAAFHVEWRFTPVEGADKYNSGVFVRNAADASVWHQAQVGEGRAGYIFGLTPVNGQPQRVNLASEMRAQRVRPAGEWNVYEVVARGRTISLWVNGAVTSELGSCAVPRGYFGLEAEGWRIEFRNLEIKPLS